MRTRNKSYKDYEFENEQEAKRLMEYCRGPDFLFRLELIVCAERANKSIADDIYYSIMKDLSYEDMVVKVNIPYSKTDFYAYRRKCLFYFKDMMRLYGRWL